MQFIDLASQYKRIQDDVDKRVLSVLGSQRYIMGPEVQEVEKALADFAGTKYAFTCGSGTDALVISLMAFGLTKEDAVFVPSFTFFASAESITLAGGTPVFVDVDKDTFNMDVEDLKKKIEEVKKEGKLKPRGIVTVDLFGRLADYDAICKIADENDMFVLEDACQGFGAEKNGKRAGSFGDVAATSFFPAKPLGCYGDGGAIFTDNDELAHLIQSIRVHGQGTDKYDNVRIGINGRFDTIQAAIILAKLAVFEDELEKRDKVSSYYIEGLKDVLETPFTDDEEVSAWAQFTLKAKDAQQRTKILEALKEADIPTAVYYPIPIHKSTAYQDLGYEDIVLPVSEELSERVFSIPMHPYLKEEDMDRIITVIKENL